MELLNNIDIAISNSGKTRGEIARELGITYNYLWRLLSGKRTMKADMIAKIAIVIGKTPNELYGPLPCSIDSAGLPSSQCKAKTNAAR